MDIVSHTLVRNGKPFIDLVLRQAIPYVNRALITISEKSNDGTLSIIRKLEREFPTKVRVFFENVNKPGELTKIRQAQLDRTYEDVVWFLDDDDYWSNESIEAMIKIVEKDLNNPEVDAWTMFPYQLMDNKFYDVAWTNRWFTKFFKFNEDVHYRGAWPRDLIYKGDEILYWKKNTKVKKVPVRFFHLSYIKGGSFRTEEWASEYKHKMGSMMKLPREEMVHIDKIYDALRKNQ